MEWRHWQRNNWCEDDGYDFSRTNDQWYLNLRHRLQQGACDNMYRYSDGRIYGTIIDPMTNKLIWRAVIPSDMTFQVVRDVIERENIQNFYDAYELLDSMYMQKNLYVVVRNYMNSRHENGFTRKPYQNWRQEHESFAPEYNETWQRGDYSPQRGRGRGNQPKNLSKIPPLRGCRPYLPNQTYNSPKNVGQKSTFSPKSCQFTKKSPSGIAAQKAGPSGSASTKSGTPRGVNSPAGPSGAIPKSIGTDVKGTTGDLKTAPKNAGVVPSSSTPAKSLPGTSSGVNSPAGHSGAIPKSIGTGDLKSAPKNAGVVPSSSTPAKSLPGVNSPAGPSGTVSNKVVGTNIPKTDEKETVGDVKTASNVNSSSSRPTPAPTAGTQSTPSKNFAHKNSTPTPTTGEVKTAAPSGTTVVKPAVLPSISGKTSAEPKNALSSGTGTSTAGENKAPLPSGRTAASLVPTPKSDTASTAATEKSKTPASSAGISEKIGSAPLKPLLNRTTTTKVVTSGYSASTTPQGVKTSSGGVPVTSPATKAAPATIQTGQVETPAPPVKAGAMVTATKTTAGSTQTANSGVSKKSVKTDRPASITATKTTPGTIPTPAPPEKAEAMVNAKKNTSGAVQTTNSGISGTSFKTNRPDSTTPTKTTPATIQTGQVKTAAPPASSSIVPALKTTSGGTKSAISGNSETPAKTNQPAFTTASKTTPGTVPTGQVRPPAPSGGSSMVAATKQTTNSGISGKPAKTDQPHSAAATKTTPAGPVTTAASGGVNNSETSIGTPVKKTGNQTPPAKNVSATKISTPASSAVIVKPSAPVAKSEAVTKISAPKTATHSQDVVSQPAKTTPVTSLKSEVAQAKPTSTVGSSQANNSANATDSSNSLPKARTASRQNLILVPVNKTPAKSEKIPPLTKSAAPINQAKSVAKNANVQGEARASSPSTPSVTTTLKFYDGTNKDKTTSAKMTVATIATPAKPISSNTPFQTAEVTVQAPAVPSIASSTVCVPVVGLSNKLEKEVVQLKINQNQSTVQENKSVEATVNVKVEPVTSTQKPVLNQKTSVASKEEAVSEKPTEAMMSGKSLGEAGFSVKKDISLNLLPKRGNNGGIDCLDGKPFATGPGNLSKVEVGISGNSIEPEVPTETHRMKQVKFNVGMPPAGPDKRATIWLSLEAAECPDSGDKVLTLIKMSNRKSCCLKKWVVTKFEKNNQTSTIFFNIPEESFNYLKKRNWQMLYSVISPSHSGLIEIESTADNVSWLPVKAATAEPPRGPQMNTSDLIAPPIVPEIPEKLQKVKFILIDTQSSYSSNGSPEKSTIQLTLKAGESANSGEEVINTIAKCNKEFSLHVLFKGNLRSWTVHEFFKNDQTSTILFKVNKETVKYLEERDFEMFYPANYCPVENIHAVSMSFDSCILLPKYKNLTAVDILWNLKETYPNLTTHSWQIDSFIKGKVKSSLALKIDSESLKTLKEMKMEAVSAVGEDQLRINFTLEESQAKNQTLGNKYNVHVWCYSSGLYPTYNSLTANEFVQYLRSSNRNLDTRFWNVVNFIKGEIRTGINVDVDDMTLAYMKEATDFFCEIGTGKHKIYFSTNPGNEIAYGFPIKEDGPCGVVETVDVAKNTSQGTNVTGQQRTNQANRFANNAVSQSAVQSGNTHQHSEDTDLAMITVDFLPNKTISAKTIVYGVKKAYGVEASGNWVNNCIVLDAKHIGSKMVILARIMNASKTFILLNGMKCFCNFGRDKYVAFFQWITRPAFNAYVTKLENEKPLSGQLQFNCMVEKIHYVKSQHKDVHSFAESIFKDSAPRWKEIKASSCVVTDARSEATAVVFSVTLSADVLKYLEEKSGMYWSRGGIGWFPVHFFNPTEKSAADDSSQQYRIAIFLDDYQFRTNWNEDNDGLAESIMGTLCGLNRELYASNWTVVDCYNTKHCHLLVLDVDKKTVEFLEKLQLEIKFKGFMGDSVMLFEIHSAGWTGYQIEWPPYPNEIFNRRLKRTEGGMQESIHGELIVAIAPIGYPTEKFTKEQLEVIEKCLLLKTRLTSMSFSFVHAKSLLILECLDYQSLLWIRRSIKMITCLIKKDVSILEPFECLVCCWFSRNYCPQFDAPTLLATIRDFIPPLRDEKCLLNVVNVEVSDRLVRLEIAVNCETLAVLAMYKFYGKILEKRIFFRIIDV